MDNRHDNSHARVFAAELEAQVGAKDVAQRLLEGGARAVCVATREGGIRVCVLYRSYRGAGEVMTLLASFRGKMCAVRRPPNAFKEWLEIVAINRDPCMYVQKGGKMQLSEELFPKDLEAMGCYCEYVEACHFYAPVLQRLDMPLPRLEDLYFEDVSDGEGDSGAD